MTPDDTLDPRALEARRGELKAALEAFRADAPIGKTLASFARLEGAINQAWHALAAQAASPWRPIAEAPRDGTSFIGAFFSIRWADSHRKNDIVRCWYQPEFDAFISSGREMVMASGYTFEDGTSRRLHSPVIEPVTHWMPLPAEPGAEATATVPEPVECERCQGNGEIVTDWDRYKHPHTGDKGDEAVVDCPDCDGIGSHSSEPQPPAAAPDRDLARRLAQSLVKPMTMQDIRLHAGEGSLTSQNILAAVYAELKRRLCLEGAAGLLGDGR